MISYHNGEWMEERDVRVPLLDRGLMLGDGLFESLAARGGRPEFLDWHLERFLGSAAVFGLRLPVAAEALRAALIEMPGRAGLADARLRLMLTRGTLDNDQGGPGDRTDDWRPSLSIIARPLPAAPPGGRRELFTASIRVASTSLAARHKTLSYADKLAARHEARARGGFDALLLNERGEVAECSISNVAWLRGDLLQTPDVECGCLPGVLRRVLLEAAAREGIEAEVGAFPVEAPRGADDLFVMNSLSHLLPVHALDGHAPRSPDGPLRRRLAAAVDELARASREALA